MNAAGNPGSKDNGVVIATAERSLGHITELLARHRIGCVVIVENEDKVCGIVSEHDVMSNARLRDIEMLEASGALPQNINFAIHGDLA